MCVSACVCFGRVDVLATMGTEMFNANWIQCDLNKRPFSFWLSHVPPTSLSRCSSGALSHIKWSPKHDGRGQFSNPKLHMERKSCGPRTRSGGNSACVQRLLLLLMTTSRHLIGIARRRSGCPPLPAALLAAFPPTRLAICDTQSAG